MDAVTFILSWNKVVDSVSLSVVLFTACVIQVCRVKRMNLPTHFQEHVYALE